MATHRLNRREKGERMQPVLTMEVRWFYKAGQTQPAFDVQRFRKGDQSLKQEKGKTRTDFYLCRPNVESLSIKVRGEEDQSEEASSRKEMMLEIKARQREDGTITFLNGVTGHLEYWSKSAFRTESTPSQILGLLQAENKAWIAVTKERYLRKYEVIDGREAVPLSSEKRSSNWCQVELTKLAVDQQIWWTLAFEALGETEDARVNNLKLSANAFFTQTGWSGFEEKDSFAYPRWLSIVTASRSDE